MAELIPYPFSALVRRALREPEQQQTIFDLPQRKFVTGDPAHDISTRFHGHRVSSPLGPAAGPQTQMAQNLVLAWLGGSRIFELKTVQIKDELTIPRPCIDMQTVGYNAEWSQELKLEQSLEEYVKGSMLVEILTASGLIDLDPGFGDLVFDLSVGYDLEGIRSQRVDAFIRGMMDARATVDLMRTRIPVEFKRFRDLDFRTKLSDSVTLSTFHGCPPEEIERIIQHLMRTYGLHCVVKFNPTLLGPTEVGRLLNDRLGYADIAVPESAFEKDATWEQAVGIMDRLGRTADEMGLSVGAKFSNTLIVANRRGFLPATEKEVYLSGAPLHVLAMNLVDRFREHFGDRFPISFAAGIDRGNFADAVALGLVPITVCSDLLKPQGYGRLQTYYQELARRMDAVGAATANDFVIRAYGRGEAALELCGPGADDPVGERCLTALLEGGDLTAAAGPDLYARWVSEARLLNTRHYAEAATADPRYGLAQNTKVPKKIGSRLELFDCVTCDKCIPVCPNDANFTFTLPEPRIPTVTLRRDGDGWTWVEGEPMVLKEKHQIANFADFCNECGNCDIFCPEDGGPYVLKPRFFGSEHAWRSFSTHDGFYLERASAGELVLGRLEGREYRLEVRKGRATFAGDGFRLTYDMADPRRTLAGDGPDEVDLTPCFIMDGLRRAILNPDRINYLNMLTPA